MNPLAWLGDKLTELLAGGILFLAQLVCSIVVSIFNVILSCFEFIFNQDMVETLWTSIKAPGGSPILDVFMNALMSVGIALIIVLSAYSIFMSIWAPLVTGGKKLGNPTGIFVRTVVAVMLVIFSKSIVKVTFSIMSKFYTNITNIGANNGVSLGGGISLSVPSGLEFDISQYLNTGTEDSGVSDIIINLSSSIGSLLACLVLIIVGWNLILFYLEVFERYAAILTVMLIAPLPLACVSHTSTEDIAKRWFRWLIGQLLLWVSQLMFIIIIKIILMNQSTFMETFGSGMGDAPAHAGFLAWACIAYGFVNIARRFEEMIGKLGLIASTTGEGLFRDLGSMIAAGKAVGAVASGAKHAVVAGAGGALGAAAAVPGGLFGAAKGASEAYKKSHERGKGTLGTAASSVAGGIRGAAKGAATAGSAGYNAVAHPIQSAKKLEKSIGNMKSEAPVSSKAGNSQASQSSAGTANEAPSAEPRDNDALGKSSGEIEKTNGRIDGIEREQQPVAEVPKPDNEDAGGGQPKQENDNPTDTTSGNITGDTATDTQTEIRGSVAPAPSGETQEAAAYVKQVSGGASDTAKPNEQQSSNIESTVALGATTETEVASPVIRGSGGTTASTKTVVNETSTRTTAASSDGSQHTSASAGHTETASTNKLGDDTTSTGQTHISSTENQTGASQVPQNEVRATAAPSSSNDSKGAQNTTGNAQTSASQGTPLANDNKPSASAKNDSGEARYGVKAASQNSRQHTSDDRADKYMNNGNQSYGSGTSGSGGTTKTAKDVYQAVKIVDTSSVANSRSQTNEKQSPRSNTSRGAGRRYRTKRQSTSKTPTSQTSSHRTPPSGNNGNSSSNNSQKH